MKHIPVARSLSAGLLIAIMKYADAAQPGEKLWEFATGGRVWSCPAIGTDGTVYVGSEDGKVYALQGATGQERWSFQTGSNVVASPALGWDDTVYVGSKDGSFYALNGATGERKWVFATDGPVELSAAISAGGTIYVSSSDKSLYALDAATGAKQWRYSRGWNVSSPGIGLEGTVYVVSDGILTALNGLTGQKIWDIPTGGVVLSPSLGSNGTVYVSRTDVYFTPPPPPGGEQRCDVRVLAFDGATGRGLWSYAREHDWGGTPPVLGPDGRLFLGTSGDCAQFGQFGCVATLGAGELVCWFRASSAAPVAYSCPAIGADGTVYLASRDLESHARIYALNGADATVRWEFAMEGAGVSSPVIGADGVVCAGVDNRVVALQGNSGPAPGVWSMERADARNTGRVVVPRRPPNIIEQPADALVAVGASLWLEVVATGVPAPTYQWSRDGQLLAGATQSVFAVGSAQPTDAGEYQVMVSNAEGGVTSRATRVVVGYRLTVSSRPAGTVEVQPSLEIFPPGQSVQLRAVPETGRRFLRWEGDGSGDDNPLTLAMDRHRQVEAVFSTRAGDLKWKVEVHGRAFSCPALGADGTLYFGLGDASTEAVQALDEETGQSLWQFPLSASSNPPGMGLGGAGTVYVGTYDRKLYALEGATGRKLWEYPIDSVALSYPALGPDGKVWVTSESTLYALDGATGQKVWELRVGRGATDPSIGPDGTVYVGASGENIGRFSAVNPATGQKQWDFATGPGVTSAAIDWDGTVYFGAGGLLYALEGSSGQECWRFAAGNQVAPPALGADGTVFLVAGSRVYGLNGTTGQRRWERQVRGVGLTPAVGLDGTVYVVSTRVEWLPPPYPPVPVATFFLDALDGLSGVPRWTWQGDGEATSPPAIGLDGTVYFGTVWWLYAFESASSGGLAASPWPKFRADAQNTGRVRPPAPLRLAISWHDDQVRIEWTTPGVLQATDALVPGDWRDVNEATSPYEVEPAIAHRFYRLRWPRQRRGGGVRREALGVRRFTGAFRKRDPPKAALKCTHSTRCATSNAVNEPHEASWSAAGPCRFSSASYSHTAEKAPEARRTPRREATLAATSKSMAAWLLAGWLITGPSLIAAQPGEKRWEFQTGGQVLSTPGLGADGTVYVGSLDRKVYALNGVTGQKRWDFATAGSVRSSPALGADGTVYVGSGDCQVYTLNGGTGERLWESVTGGYVRSAPAIGADGTVYVGSEDMNIYALEAATGAQRWEFATGGWIFYSSPAIGPDGTLYVGSTDAKVYALHTGSTLADAPWPVSGSNSRHTGSAQFAGPPSVLHEPVAAEALPGDRVRLGVTVGGTLPLSYQWFRDDVALADGDRIAGAHAPLLDIRTVQETDVGGYSVVIANEQGSIASLTAHVSLRGFRGGDLRWSFQTGGPVASSPALGVDGMVFVGSDDKHIYALSGATGTKVWEFATGEPVRASPAIGRDGTVYAGSDRFYALHGLTGAKSWEFAAGVSASPAIGRNGTVYVGVTGTWPATTTLYALDGSTGGVLWKRGLGTFDHPEWLTSCVSVGGDGTVYAVVNRAPSSFGVWVLDGATGALRRYLPTTYSAASPAFGVDGTLIAASYPGNFCYAADALTGVERWETYLGGILNGSPTIAAGGSVFVGTADGLWALDLATGAQRWEFTSGGGNEGSTTSPALAADGTVYVGSSDKRFYALIGSTGALRWEFVAGGPIRSSPVVGTDGTVYFGSDDGRVYALRGDSPLADAPWPMISRNARHTGSAEPDAPLRLSISRQEGKVLIEWVPPGVLQWSEVLVRGAWQDMNGATSPYAVNPANARCFYRLRRPRRIGGTAGWSESGITPPARTHSWTRSPYLIAAAGTAARPDPNVQFRSPLL